MEAPRSMNLTLRIRRSSFYGAHKIPPSLYDLHNMLHIPLHDILYYLIVVPLLWASNDNVAYMPMAFSLVKPDLLRRQRSAHLRVRFLYEYEGGLLVARRSVPCA
jgi:hypothetical protein